MKKYIITEKQLRKLNNQHGEIIAHEDGYAYHYPDQQNRRTQPLEEFTGLASNKLIEECNDLIEENYHLKQDKCDCEVRESRWKSFCDGFLLRDIVKCNCNCKCKK